VKAPVIFGEFVLLVDDPDGQDGVEIEKIHSLKFKD
jgi:hypothetical protein